MTVAAMGHSPARIATDTEPPFASPARVALTPKSRRARGRRASAVSIDSLESLKFNSDESAGSLSSSSGHTTPARRAAVAGDVSHLNGADGSEVVEHISSPGGSAAGHPILKIKSETAVAAGTVGSLRNRASGLTKVSGLEGGPPRARGASKQMLLDGSSTTQPLETRKKRAVRKTAKPRETASATTLVAPKAHTETVAPFWLAPPKDVKDISTYMKTICARLSHIEKQMKRFEAERQGLLNVLYQSNVQHLQAAPPSGQGGSSDDRSGQATRAESNPATGGASGGTSVDAAAGGSSPASPGRDVVDRVYDKMDVDSVQHSSRAPHPPPLEGVQHENYGAPDGKNANSGGAAGPSSGCKSGHPSQPSAGRSQAAPVSSGDRHPGNCGVIEIDDDDGGSVHPRPAAAGADPEFHAMTECSKQMLRDISRLSNMLDDDLELSGLTQLERNVANYNIGNFMESNTKHDFQMWRSCWLKPSQPNCEASPMRQAKRAVGRPRGCHRGGAAPSTSSSSSTAPVAAPPANPPPPPEEPAVDGLQYFWDLDFRSLSQPQVTRWAQFFGVKTSVSLKMQVEAMEKIRSYLVAFAAK